jgi:hypothetical protein
MAFAALLCIWACQISKSPSAGEPEHGDSRVVWDCRALEANHQTTFRAAGFEDRIYHSADDPDSDNRIEITSADLNVEILPSKGLSVGRASYCGRSLFWDPALRYARCRETGFSGR